VERPRPVSRGREARSVEREDLDETLGVHWVPVEQVMRPVVGDATLAPGHGVLLRIVQRPQSG
jgi:hypothetical protein